MGHEVTVLVPHEPGEEPDDRPFRLVPVGEGRPPIRMAGFLREAGRRMATMANDGLIDIAHVTFDYPTFTVGLPKGIPCVATVHHLHKVEALSLNEYEASLARRAVSRLRGSLLTYLEGRMARQCAHVIAVSEFTASSVRNYLGISQGKITVVRNGIETSQLEKGDPAGFRREYPGVGEDMVLFVGRLERPKGLNYLIPAFARASKVSPRATLVIVGRGKEEYVDELKRLAKQGGVDDKVIFTGRLPQPLLPGAYAASRVLVLPSLMEGFGISLLESMAAGRPCIATRVGAIPELVVDGETGIIVDPADPAELGGAITKILSDRELSSRMGGRGREIVNQDFTLEIMVKKTEEVYRKVLEPRNK
jgi:L-malate glycosyltransferase